MEPDFLTLLIIATPGALISLLCFVLAGVFMDRADRKSTRLNSSH